MLNTFSRIRKKDNTRISINQYNAEIDEAIKRVQSGDFYTQDEIEKLSKDW